MKTFLYLFAILTITTIIFFCKDENSLQKGAPEYIAEVNQWHQDRIEKLKDENGWLTLVGLYWLKEGESTFGSDESNDIVFPDNAPATIGTIILKDSTISLKADDGANITHRSDPVKEMKLRHDLTGDPTVLATESLRFYIIKRGEKFGIRLRDTEAELRNELNTIERFPVNDNWRLKAKFDVYDPPRTISLPTQLGTVVEEKSPGAAEFMVNGEKYRLDAIDTGKRFWFIFADETNGKETYGAGRYLYTDKPDSTGKMIIDFNYAYNPPCVFTKFATCSFAPEQNQLRLRVTAGEKSWK